MFRLFTPQKAFVLIVMVMILSSIRIVDPKRLSKNRIKLGIRHRLVENLVRCRVSHELDESNIVQFLPAQFQGQKEKYIILGERGDGYFLLEIADNKFLVSTKAISSDANRKIVYLGHPIIIDVSTVEENHCIIGFENLSTYSTDMDMCSQIIHGNTFFCTRDENGKYTIETCKD